jgi:NADH-quinone oxidoreductase subunit H
MSFFNALLFLGGWLPIIYSTPFLWIPEIIWLSIKVTLFVFLFVWTRASLPRIRFDQLMYLGWKSYLPLSLAYLIFIIGILIGWDWIPPLTL